MIKSLKKVLLLVVLLICGVAIGSKKVSAQEGVSLDVTNFPDEIFRNYVASLYDTNKDNCLSTDEIAKATKLYVEMQCDVKTPK